LISFAFFWPASEFSEATSFLKSQAIIPSRSAPRLVDDMAGVGGDLDQLQTPTASGPDRAQ
jgi:hypothetical protein